MEQLVQDMEACESDLSKHSLFGKAFGDIDNLFDSCYSSFLKSGRSPTGALSFFIVRFLPTQIEH
jgi:hypothetical protein